jgi:hypothetical protein
MGAGVASLAQQSLQLNRNDAQETVAYYAARAGVEDARCQLSKNSALGGYATPQSMPSGAAYTVALLTTLPDGSAVPSGFTYVLSTGYANNGVATAAHSRVGALVQLSGSTPATLPEGLFMRNGITFDGSIDVWGWNDATQLTTTNAGVGTNSIQAAAVNLYGTSGPPPTINGNLTIGKLGVPANVVSMQNGAQITGGVNVSNLNFTLNAPAPPASMIPPLPPAPVTVPGGTFTLPPGTYGSATITGASVLTLVDGGTYYIDGDLIMQGSASIELPANATQGVTVYLSGNVSIQGTAAMNNYTHKPGLFAIYGCAPTYNGTNYMDVSGGDNAYFTLYAPNYDLNAQGSATVYGTLVGNSLNQTGSAQIYVDSNISPNPSGTVFASGGGSGGSATVVSLQRN